MYCYNEILTSLNLVQLIFFFSLSTMQPKALKLLGMEVSRFEFSSFMSCTVGLFSEGLVEFACEIA